MGAAMVGDSEARGELVEEQQAERSVETRVSAARQDVVRLVFTSGVYRFGGVGAVVRVSQSAATGDVLNRVGVTPESMGLKLGCELYELGDSYDVGPPRRAAAGNICIHSLINVAT